MLTNQRKYTKNKILTSAEDISASNRRDIRDTSVTPPGIEPETDTWRARLSTVELVLPHFTEVRHALGFS